MEGPLKQDRPMKHLASLGSSSFSFTSICHLISSIVPEASVNVIWAGIIAQKIIQQWIKSPLKHQIWTYQILPWSAQCLQHTLDLLNVSICLEVAWIHSTLILSWIFKQQTYKCSKKSACLPNWAHLGPPYCSSGTIQFTRLHLIKCEYKIQNSPQMLTWYTRNIIPAYNACI